MPRHRIRNRVAALILGLAPALAPSLVPAWAAPRALPDTSEPPRDTLETCMAAPAADHGCWSALLATYVQPGPDGVNRVDYGAWKASDDDRARLQAYLEGFARLDFDALTRDAAFAAWVNLYNALTVEHILSRYPLDSIRDGYLFGGPWKEVTIMAGGRRVSLDGIEHDILREQWDEPRVHYAVNCASIGCPNLKRTAWVAGTLDADLDAAAEAYINHPRGVRRVSDGVRVSRIYKWFREDFGGSEAGVIAHLAAFADPDLAAHLQAHPDIRGHAYDWALNDVEEGTGP